MSLEIISQSLNTGIRLNIEINMITNFNYIKLINGLTKGGATELLAAR